MKVKPESRVETYLLETPGGQMYRVFLQARVPADQRVQSRKLRNGGAMMEWTFLSADSALARAVLKVAIEHHVRQVMDKAHKTVDRMQRLLEEDLGV